MTVAVIQRWELVQYEIDLPCDHHDVSKVLDDLRAELGEQGDRWQYRETVKVTVEDGDRLVFCYRKART